MVATGLTPFFIYNYIKNNYYDKGKDELILEIFLTMLSYFMLVFTVIRLLIVIC